MVELQRSDKKEVGNCRTVLVQKKRVETKVFKK